MFDLVAVGMRRSVRRYSADGKQTKAGPIIKRAVFILSARPCFALAGHRHGLARVLTKLSAQKHKRCVIGQLCAKEGLCNYC